MKILVYEWEKGFKLISLVQFLMSEGDLGLKKAKDLADGLLDGSCFEFNVITSKSLENIISELEALGVKCKKAE